MNSADQFAVSKMGKWLSIGVMVVGVAVFSLIFLAGALGEIPTSGRRVPWFIAIAGQPWGMAIVGGLALFCIYAVYYLLRNYPDVVQIDNEGVRTTRDGRTVSGIRWDELKEYSVKGKNVVLKSSSTTLSLPLGLLPSEARNALSSAFQSRGIRDVVPR